MALKLSNLEHSVISKILDGNHKKLIMLKKQIEFCTVHNRDYTGVGFFTEITVHDQNLAIPDCNTQFGDVNAKIPGLKHGAGFLLYIKCGLINLLEGYTYDEPWPASSDECSIHYQSEASRTIPRELLDSIGT